MRWAGPPRAAVPASVESHVQGKSLYSLFECTVPLCECRPHQPPHEVQPQKPIQSSRESRITTGHNQGAFDAVAAPGCLSRARRLCSSRRCSSGVSRCCGDMDRLRKALLMEMHGDVHEMPRSSLCWTLWPRCSPRVEGEPFAWRCRKSHFSRNQREVGHHTFLFAGPKGDGYSGQAALPLRSIQKQFFGRVDYGPSDRERRRCCRRRNVEHV